MLSFALAQQRAGPAAAAARALVGQTKKGGERGGV